MARIIIFGEILWDCLPSGPRLGGAPLNVAANLSLLGHEAILISAVGRDSFGDEALGTLQRYGVDTRFVLRSDFPTGTVEVSLDEKGDASYRFTPDCAWHDLGSLFDGKELPKGDALLFGSLANHQGKNWRWLKKQAVAFKGPKFCDINLREPWDLERVSQIASAATVLKCNDAEFEVLTKIPATIGDTGLLKKAKERFPSFPDQLCVTFGKNGALYFSENNEVYRGVSDPVEVVDSIGAGDAFMAGLIHQCLCSLGKLPENFLNVCCKLGAEAASRSGALPELH